MLACDELISVQEWEVRRHTCSSIRYLDQSSTFFTASQAAGETADGPWQSMLLSFGMANIVKAYKSGRKDWKAEGLELLDLSAHGVGIVLRVVMDSDLEALPGQGSKVWLWQWAHHRTPLAPVRERKASHFESIRTCQQLESFASLDPLKVLQSNLPSCLNESQPQNYDVDKAGNIMQHPTM